MTLGRSTSSMNAQGLLGGVEDVGLVPVAELQAERHAGLRRAVGDPRDRLDGVGPAALGDRRRILAELGVEDAAEVGAADVAGELDRGVERAAGRGRRSRGPRWRCRSPRRGRARRRRGCRAPGGAVAVMSASKFSGSSAASWMRSYPASLEDAMARRASSGDQPPTQHSAWIPMRFVVIERSLVFWAGSSGGRPRALPSPRVPRGPSSPAASRWSGRPPPTPRAPAVPPP